MDLKIIGKFGIAILFDIVDFFIGRIPIFGTLFDIVGGILSIILWGPWGAIQLGEILDATDQLDGFIPSVTIAGIIATLTQRTSTTQDVKSQCKVDGGKWKNNKCVRI